ncbi:hypothetical protein [Microbacterium terrisoli]|uniref:hypothetical protein n=1 Tax=Microbacterium terrisoli TaxID=3242192 RepID=UPI00280538C3|nr:hypothetical protein [Microbacterium protaetiae]
MSTKIGAPITIKTIVAATATATTTAARARFGVVVRCVVSLAMAALYQQEVVSWQIV